MGTPKASGGRSIASHTSQATAKADAMRASHEGHRARSSPPHAGHVAGSSASNSSK
jgi:hypothetical protein